MLMPRSRIICFGKLSGGIPKRRICALNTCEGTTSRFDSTRHCFSGIHQ